MTPREPPVTTSVKGCLAQPIVNAVTSGMVTRNREIVILLRSIALHVNRIFLTPFNTCPHQHQRIQIRGFRNLAAPP